MTEPKQTILNPLPDITAPGVSIVLPTHNGERYIEQAIQSIIDQTYNNWQLLVVDDGSTDKTADIVDLYARADPRIHLYRNTNNVGLPVSLNIGSEHARGTYLTWTSDDNYYAPEALALMVEALETDPELCVVVAGMQYVDEFGDSLGQFLPGPIDNISFTNVIGGCFLYKSEVHHRIGGYRHEYSLVEDWDFFLRAYSQGYRFQVLRKSLYHYRKHANSLTRSRAARARFARDSMLYQYLSSTQRLDDAAVAPLLFRIGKRSVKAGHYGLAVRCLMRSLRRDPISSSTTIVSLLFKKLMGKRSAPVRQ